MPLSVFEFVPEYAVEPELLRAAPRRLRLATWPTAAIFGCCAVFAVLLSCALFIALRSAELIALAGLGRSAVAHVSACEYSDGSVGGCNSAVERGQAVRVDYDFGPNLATRGSAATPLFDGDLPIEANRSPYAQPEGDLGEQPRRPFRSPIIPRLIAVRYVRIGSATLSAPISSLRGRSVALGLAVSLAVAGMTIAVCLRFGRWLGRTFDLLRGGEVAVATIIAKEIHESDLPRYFVTYGFVDSGGAPRERSERCIPEQWRRLEIGHEATVLYPKAQPMRAELYAHLPLRCA